MSERVRQSKFLSLILRHKPAGIGLHLNSEGWAELEEIVQRSAAGRTPLTRSVIEEIVASSDKQRFSISADGLRIRANQGHSIAVDLGLKPSSPPKLLYHGTASRFLDAIEREGLVKGSRQHVHLSTDYDTALRVGRRHGDAIVLTVDAEEMSRRSFIFFLSRNGVWLTDSVPAVYLSVHASSSQPKAEP